MDDKYPALSAAAIDEARALIGVPLRRRPHYTTAGKEVLLRYAQALGCRNPLYTDISHGLLNTPWASLVGHPTVIFGFDSTVIAPKLPGIHSIYAGVDIEWFRQIRADDEINAVARLTKVEELSGEFCGPMVLQTGEVEYSDAHGDVVAIARPQVMRTPRDAARRRGKYMHLTRPHYSADDLGAIIAAYRDEFIRGTTPLYFEDVGVGDELPTVVKGPLTTEDMNFFVGEITETLFFQSFLSHIRRHPADVFWHDNGMPDSWDASLLEDAPAKEFGFPCAHDTGLQRVAWLEMLVTNWMGDLALLRRLNVRLHRPMLHADTAWLAGEVTAKRAQHGAAIVEVAVRCVNQRGEITASGHAEAEMPARSFDLREPGLVLSS
jgi:hypothetical protein